MGQLHYIVAGSWNPIVHESTTSWPTNMLIHFHVQWANMSYLIKILSIFFTWVRKKNSEHLGGTN